VPVRDTQTDRLTDKLRWK